MGTSLAILAGGGQLPRHLAKACRDQGHDVHIVAFDGHTDPATVKGFSHLWAPLGQAAPVLDWLRSQGVTDIVFFGPLRRPSLTELRPDWRAARFFAKAGLRALGDDGLMRAVARTLEVEEGFRVRVAALVGTTSSSPLVQIVSTALPLSAAASVLLAWFV
jgi:DUF1009 family protein